MAGRGSELDFDELEMLLGEIPKVTYVNPCPGDSKPSVSFSDLESISTEKEDRKSTSRAFTDSYDPPPEAKQVGNTTSYNGSTFERTACTNAFGKPFDQKLQWEGNFGGDKIGMNSDGILVVNQCASNLPDDQSLNAAFEQLSFKNENDCAAAGSTMTGSVDIKTLSNCPTLLEVQSPNSLKKSFLDLDTVGMTVNSSLNGMHLADQALELHPSLTTMNGLEKVDWEMKQISMSCPPPKSHADNLKEPQQGLPMYSRAMPFAPKMHSYQMPVPELEFSASTFQQPNCLDAQSSPYLEPQKLNGFHLAWEQQMERESRGRMHPQYLHQLQNQGSKSDPIQANNDFPMELISRKPRQPMNFDMPISHQLKLANGGSYWTCYPDHVPMGSKGCCHSQEYYGRGESYQLAHGQKQTSAGGLTSPSLPATELQGVRVFDKRINQIFPEKILTRSHGLNSLKDIKTNFIEGFELPDHVNSKGQVFSNGHSHPPFQLYGRSSRVSFPDDADFRFTSKLHLQRHNSVDEVVGRIYLLAKDQNGCRFLQRKLVEGTSEDVNKIFIETIDHIVELMTDPFGNYLVQKLLEVCNEDQKKLIIHVVTRKAGELVRVACDMHGTRAVQKMIETIKSPEQIFMVVSSLRPGIVALIKDTNGNHVAQRCLQYLMPEYSKFLFYSASVHCVDLAMDRHGCCVLQKCLQNIDGEQKQMLMSEIASNALLLSQDQYGNYAVQFIIDQGVPWATENVLNQLDGNYGYLSMQKYSSNVVEKCLRFAGEDCRARIILELINHPHFEQISQDPFGNYVVQSALAESKGPLHTALVEAIKPHVPALRNSPYGKKILTRNRLKK